MIRDKADNKYIISYIAALGIFGVVCMLRFFERDINSHDNIFSFMDNYAFAIVMTYVYAAAFVVLAAIALYSAKEIQDINKLIFLFICAAVFIFSMYWNEDYLGSSDIYGYMLSFISFILLIKKKARFLIPLLSAAGVILAPLSVLSIQLLTLMLLIILTRDSEDGRLKIISIANAIAVAVALIAGCFFAGFNADVVGDISISHVVLMAILFIPCYILLIVFARQILHNKLYITAMLVGLIGVITEGILQDPARAIFYGFTYYILLIGVLYACKHKDTIEAIDNMDTIVRSYLEYPILIPAYLFVMVTLWISGPLPLLKEIIVAS